MSRRGFAEKKICTSEVCSIFSCVGARYGLESIENMWDSETRSNLHAAMIRESELLKIDMVDDEEFVIAAVKQEMKPITWDEIRLASNKDQDIQQVIQYLQEGSRKVVSTLTDEAKRLVMLETNVWEDD